MSTPHERALNELTRRLKTGLGNKLHSIVLYGSVARKEATEDSDIDILVLTSDKGLEKLISDLSYDLNFEEGYKVLLAPLHLSVDEFYRLVRLGSPFLANVMEEGKVLYDDGTYEGVHRRLFAASR